MRPQHLIWLGATALVLAGCGTTTTTPSAPAPTGSAAAAATPSAAATTIKVASATVGGTSEQILVTASSALPLYYFSLDTPTSSHCTGSCASIWPPLLQRSGQPTASGSASGTLTVLADANGSQVEYSGHPLYRFTGDTPGQVTGDGMVNSGGTWHVATPSLTMAGPSVPSSSAAASPSSPSGY